MVNEQREMAVARQFVNLGTQAETQLTSCLVKNRRSRALLYSLECFNRDSLILALLHRGYTERG